VITHNCTNTTQQYLIRRLGRGRALSISSKPLNFIARCPRLQLCSLINSRKHNSIAFNSQVWKGARAFNLIFSSQFHCALPPPSILIIINSKITTQAQSDSRSIYSAQQNLIPQVRKGTRGIGWTVFVLLGDDKSWKRGQRALRLGAKD